jgi:hypothetical protein
VDDAATAVEMWKVFWVLLGLGAFLLFLSVCIMED